VASYPDDDPSGDRLLKFADGALHAISRIRPVWARARGPGVVECWRPMLNSLGVEPYER
jgi:hypothetical protein